MAQLGRLDDDLVRAAALDVHAFALLNPDGLYWGHAQDYGSFGYRLRPEGRLMSLFTYYTTGTIYFNVGTLRSKVNSDLFERFMKSLAGLRGFERLGSAEGGYPQFQTRETLADQDVREGFKSAVLDLQSAINVAA